MQRLLGIFLTFAGLSFNHPASANSFELAKKVLHQLCLRTPVVLTFAGVKPVTMEFPDPYGMSAEDLVSTLNQLRAAGFPLNPNWEWRVQSFGASHKKNVLFIHRGAVERLAATEAGQRYLAGAGIPAGISSEQRLERLIRLYDRGMPQQTPAEYSATGFFFGFPETQVESFRKVQERGGQAARDGEIVPWFKGVRGDGPGFAKQADDQNQAELRLLSDRAQSAWELYFQETEIRKNDPLDALVTLDQQPLTPNSTRAFRCQKAFEQFLKH